MLLKYLDKLLENTHEFEPSTATFSDGGSIVIVNEYLVFQKETVCLWLKVAILMTG